MRLELKSKAKFMTFYVLSRVGKRHTIDRRAMLGGWGHGALGICENFIKLGMSQCSKIRKKVQFQKYKHTFFAISKMAKNKFLHQKKV